MDNKYDVHFLDLTIEELELILGEHLIGDSWGAKEATDDHKRTVWRNWFKKNIDRLREVVCVESVLDILGPEKKDRNTIFVTLFDILSVAFFGALPVAALTAMIIHYGIENLCEEIIKE